MSAVQAGLADEASSWRPGTRSLEIVTTRGQRRARPRLVVAIGTVAGLFAILTAQLLLSIATSEGAYEISTLQARQGEIARDQQVMAESLEVLEAPQHLSAEAQAMGMVANSSAAYLRLADAAVLGTPSAASSSAALRTADDGTSLIPNSLLSDVPLVAAGGEAGTAREPRSAEATGPTPTGQSLPGTTQSLPGTTEAGTGTVQPPVPPAGIPTPSTH